MVEREYHTLPRGTLLHNRYVIGDVLGEGGFGITYSGYDQVLEYQVAIKEFFPRGIASRNNNYSNYLTVSQTRYQDYYLNEKKKFLREARTLARFNKEDGIVSVNDFFEDNNTAYIVMEYLDGINLKQYIEMNGVLSVNDVLEIMAPLMKTLESVHREGLVHRDISPDNIMLLFGKGVKLMDFGAARDYTDSGEHSKSIVLKHGYAPEEQYRRMGLLGPWTDVYALCATIYKCITGITPEESLQRLQEDTLIRPSRLGVEISPDVERTLMKGMSIYQKDRYSTIGNLYYDLYGVPIHKGYKWVKQDPAYGGERNSDVTGSSYQDPPSTGSGSSSGSGGSALGPQLAVGILIGMVLILTMSITFLYLNWKLRDHDGPDTGKTTAASGTETSQTEEETEQQTEEKEEETEATTQESTEEPSEEPLPYTDNEYPDVYSCLDPSSYAVETSPQKDYSFGYPMYLFNKSGCNYEDNSFWLQYVDDEGDLPYELYVYQEYNSGDPMENASVQYADHKELLEYVSADYFPKWSEDAGMARGSVGGILDSSLDKCAYYIFASDGEKDYVLEFIYTGDPDPQSEYDEIDYVVDCIYRYCSFSTATYKPRSFEQFKKNDMGEKK